MEKAYISNKGNYVTLVSGEPLTIDAAFYDDYILPNGKKIGGVPVCICCGKRVYTCQEKGISDQQATPGFFHFDKQANENCAAALADFLRFDPILNTNQFSALVIEQNRARLKPYETQNVRTLGTLMKRITGSDDLSPVDINAFKKIENIFVSMVGFYPELLPYLQASYAGVRERRWASGTLGRVGYAWTGQVLSFSLTDAPSITQGRRKDKPPTLFLPGEYLQLSHGGKADAPVRGGQSKSLVRFKVPLPHGEDAVMELPHRSAKPLPASQKQLPAFTNG